MGEDEEDKNNGISVNNVKNHQKSLNSRCGVKNIKGGKQSYKVGNNGVISR